MTGQPWWKRALLGPTDQEISDRSVPAGALRYPIPTPDPRMPTPLAATGRFIQATEPGMSWQQAVNESETAVWVARRRRSVAPDRGEDVQLLPQPRLTRTYPPPPADKDTIMNDPAPGLGENLRAAGLGSDQPVTGVTGRAVHPDSGRYMIDAEYAPDPLTDSGIHAIDEQPERTVNVTCPTCKGSGHMERTVSELLRESIALIPADGGQQVITEFYRRLLTAAPDLAALFPPDLITAAVDDTASPGRLQRDKLLQALAALADLYGTSPADRQRLDTALRAYGRHHAAFARPDGTTRGATVEEYLVVKQALMDTLHTAAGAAWLPAYDAAWAEAYDYAMIVMLYEQMTGGMTFPRQPRTAMPAPRPRDTNA